LANDIIVENFVSPRALGLRNGVGFQFFRKRIISFRHPLKYRAKILQAHST
jgi:hypothetical protein